MYGIDVLFQDEENEDFLSISRAMEEIVDDPVDCYWLIKCFVNQFHMKFGDSVPHLVSAEFMCCMLFQSKLSVRVCLLTFKSRNSVKHCQHKVH